ncbi:unnamed protein product [Dovyalis caffra]|uniref:Uncharacterized protein n=1 Tax=Dovyalis caffra TaxID=77055 RepID=A0AAV1QYZ2_9ROSI|nr:unnamed protein product [Dovyalis caffra]
MDAGVIRLVLRNKRDVRSYSAKITLLIHWKLIRKELEVEKYEDRGGYRKDDSPPRRTHKPLLDETRQHGAVSLL